MKMNSQSRGSTFFATLGLAFALQIAGSLTCIEAFSPLARADSTFEEEGTDPLDDLISLDELSEEIGAPKDAPEHLSIDRLEALIRGSSSKKMILPSTGLSTQEWVSLQNEIDKDRAKVVLIINKAIKGNTSQKLIAFVDGVEFGRFDVSTGREKYETAKSGRSYWTSTPVGYFRPTVVKKQHYSNTWKAYMNWTVFFRGGVAIHATTPDHYKELGSRASGGCVRMRDEQAKEIFDLVVAAGQGTVPLINRDGEVAVNAQGKELSTQGYNTLIIVRNLED